MYFILAPAQNLKTSRTVCVQLSVGQKMDSKNGISEEVCVRIMYCMGGPFVTTLQF